MNLFLEEPFAGLWEEKDPFAEAFALEGQSYRDMGDRKTSRFEVNGKGYFIKTHAGVGLKEIVKNLLYLRLPVLGAKNEFQAINRLQELGVDTLKAVAFGRQGANPSRQKSFLITEALEPTTPLDEYLNKAMLKQAGVRERRRLVKKLAVISRTLHSNGVNHRDYYLCHFLLDRRPQSDAMPISNRPIYLIDLHRVQLRKRTPGRWRRKDLAGLYYSAKRVGFDDRDALSFIKNYDQKPLAKSLANRRFWKKIASDADRLYSKGERKGYHG